MTPQTLFQLAGLAPRPPRLGEAVLVLVDYQNEYLDGPLRLAGPEAAVERAGALLAAARDAGARIIHVVHRGAAGGLFDRAQARGAIIDALAPRPGEPVVEKSRPNSFSSIDLGARIGAAGTPLLLAGFMTHHCVSSTARAALDLGYPLTIAADACATRDLPWQEGVVGAADLHRAELAALADRHACVMPVAAVVAEPA
jgi:nicotinamidase-related amidase